MYHKREADLLEPHALALWLAGALGLGLVPDRAGPQALLAAVLVLPASTEYTITKKQ